MGRYDNCREGYCGLCGQVEGVIWACGRCYCSTYHQWLRSNAPDKYEKLMSEIKAEREAAEEDRVTRRQIARRTKAIAEEARKEFE